MTEITPTARIHPGEAVCVRCGRRASAEAVRAGLWEVLDDGDVCAQCITPDEGVAIWLTAAQEIFGLTPEGAVAAAREVAAW